MTFNPFAHVVASDSNPLVFRTFASAQSARVWASALKSDGHEGIYMVTRSSESDPSFYLRNES